MRENLTTILEMEDHAVLTATKGRADIVLIGGSLIGGNFFDSGKIGDGKIGNFTLGGSILGGQNTTSTSNSEISLLEVNGDLKTLTIGGDLVAGTYGSGVHVPYNGAVLVEGNLGSATIKGSILGNSGQKAILLAGGVAPVAPGNFHAIGKLTVGGDVSYGYLAAGHTRWFQSAIGVAENPDVGSSSVTVGGNWFHSNLNAGISDLDSDGLTNTDTRPRDRPTGTRSSAQWSSKAPRPITRTPRITAASSRRRSPASRSAARRSSKAATPRNSSISTATSMSPKSNSAPDSSIVAQLTTTP